MQDINELMNIIKKTDADFEISSENTNKIKKWVDKNRNLACEMAQINLINMVETMLKNHYINETDKNKLISICSNLTVHTQDKTAIFDEIDSYLKNLEPNTILNENTLNTLSDFRTRIINYTSNSYNSSIVDAIEKIIINRIAISSDLTQLILNIKVLIKNLKFETKLEHLYELVRSRQNIGIELIELLDDKLAIKKIHEKAEEQLVKELYRSSGYTNNQEIIVISLVLIAMLNYDGGNYYGGVRETYKKAYSLFSEVKVEGHIRSILGRFKKCSGSGSRSLIINVALENAIVPQLYLSGFFEFIYDIYKLNFENNLVDDLENGFRFVYENLREHLLFNNDTLTVNATQKTYKLIVSTKRLLTQENGLDAIIKLSIIIVKLIDKRFWDEEINIFNPYLKAGFEKWDKQFSIRRHRKYSSRQINESFHSSWEPKFCIKNRSIYLVPPSHSIKARNDISAVRCIVTNGEDVLFDGKYDDVREIIGGYKITMTDGILIEKPLGKLSYKIICGKEIIYDSKDKLYRNHIVFNTENNEIKNNTDYNGTALFCCDTPHQEMNQLLRKKNYYILSKNIKKGDTIKFCDEIFNFSTMINPGILGTIHKNCIIKTESNPKIDVFKSIDFLVFETDNPSGLFDIVIDGISHRLDKMNYNLTARENTTRYTIHIEVDKPGIHIIEVVQLIKGNKNRILKQKFAYDPELIYEYSKTNNCSGNVSVISGILPQKIQMVIESRNFDESFIRFNADDTAYKYYIPFNFGFYKLSDQWHSFSEELWINDIKNDSELIIYESELDRILVCDAEDKVIENDIVIQDCLYFKKIGIGFLLSYKHSTNFIKLKFISHDRVKYTLYCYNSCIMKEDETEILFYDNTNCVQITPYFFGKNKIFYEVSEENGNVIYKSPALTNGQTDSLSCYESFRQYTINFYEKKSGLLSIGEKKPFFSVRKVFCSKCDLVGNTFKIHEAYFNTNYKKEFIEKKMYFNKMFLSIDKMTEDNIFLGRILFKTTTSEKYYKEINPVKIEVCSEIIDDTMDIYIVNDEYGDGLMLDRENRIILDSMDDPDAPDIFLYTIRTREEK